MSIVDPVVRMHSIDERISGDIPTLLTLLREVQRRYLVAVAWRVYG